MKDETQKAAHSLPLCGFLVIGTKKGGFPIAVETRSKGKKVTVLTGVRGDLHALLTTLTSRMGVGGTYHEDRSQVEIQGDQSERLPRILFQLGCLRGVNVKDFEEQPATAAASSAQPHVREKPRWDKEKIAYENAAMEDKKKGGCWNWHGWWPYCRGNCTRPNPYDNDIWTHNIEGESKRITYVPEFTDIMEGLRDLGMLSEPGEAVKAEHLERALAARGKHAGGTKPAKPQRVFSPVNPAPLDQAFVCKYCQQQFSMRRTLKIHITRIHNYENARVATGGAWDGNALHQQWGPTPFNRKAATTSDDMNPSNDWPEDWVDWKNDTPTNGWGGTRSGWNNGGSSSSDHEERRAPQRTMGSMLQLPKKEMLKLTPRKKTPAALPVPPVADMNCMTEEMLQNLLEMDFNPAQSELFFSTLADRGKEMSMDEAFIEALVVVLEAPDLNVFLPHEMSDHEPCFRAFPSSDNDNDDTLNASFVNGDFRAAPSDDHGNTAFTMVKSQSRKPPPFKSPPPQGTATESSLSLMESSTGSSVRTPLAEMPSVPVVSSSSAPYKASSTPSAANAPAKWTPKAPPPVRYIAPSSASSSIPSNAKIKKKAPKAAAAAATAAVLSVRAAPTPLDGKTLQEYRKMPEEDDTLLNPVVASYNCKNSDAQQQQRNDVWRRPPGVCLHCEADVGERNLARHMAENHACPMCGCIYSPEFIEIHVNVCLEEHRKKDEEEACRKEEEVVPCPLCAQVFSSSEIAQHAAFCNGA
eukprot:GEMP01010824.1.p1 GENE.GEMP01010824.1~~GEMP01010824.1.p1  ORF type:complete len:753 (+),score=177.67 GEMP01010824.1:27-2285(+)